MYVKHLRGIDATCFFPLLSKTWVQPFPPGDQVNWQCTFLLAWETSVTLVTTGPKLSGHRVFSYRFLVIPLHVGSL